MNRFIHSAIIRVAAPAIAWALPLPLFAATISVEFAPGEGEPKDYETVRLMLVPIGVQDATAVVHEFREKRVKHAFKDLEPGRYMVWAETAKMGELMEVSAPGPFRSIHHVELKAPDSRRTVNFKYRRFDKKRLRGDQQIRGRIVDSSGSPQADRPILIVASVANVGGFILSRTRTSSSGEFVLEGVSPEFEHYVYNLEEDALGAVKPGADNVIHLAPSVGDAAPEAGFTLIENKASAKLSDYRGKVVVLDFWATWCGPCQEPMAAMQTYHAKNPDWGDRVALISLSVDEKRETAARHLKQKGWNRTLNAWAGPKAFEADAPLKFAVQGIPSAFVIDPRGKIVAAGHPASLDIPKRVSEMLNPDRQN